MFDKVLNMPLKEIEIGCIKKDVTKITLIVLYCNEVVYGLVVSGHFGTKKPCKKNWYKIHKDFELYQFSCTIFVLKYSNILIINIAYKKQKHILT